MSPAIMTMALLALSSAAGASNCMAVRDSDRRQECLAIQRGEPADCLSIKNWDDRERCRWRARQRSL